MAGLQIQIMEQGEAQDQGRLACKATGAPHPESYLRTPESACGGLDVQNVQNVSEAPELQTPEQAATG